MTRRTHRPAGRVVPCRGLSVMVPAMTTTHAHTEWTVCRHDGRSCCDACHTDERPTRDLTDELTADLLRELGR